MSVALHFQAELKWHKTPGMLLIIIIIIIIIVIVIALQISFIITITGCDCNVDFTNQGLFYLIK